MVHRVCAWGIVKIHILSDLHTELTAFSPAAADADVVVLAGDIGGGVGGLDWAARHAQSGGAFAGKDVIYVAGNHEYYGRSWNSLPGALRHRAREIGLPGLHLLDCDQVIIGDVRFLGCELWTDFALFGSDPSAVAGQMAACRTSLADFHRIRDDGRGDLRPEMVLDRHLRQRAWLAATLREPAAGRWRKTVVVTHHLPSMQSVEARWRQDLASAGFASNLDDIVEQVDGIWIHGHTHASFDYPIAGCRVICNPRGYVGVDGAVENPRFDDRLVVAV